MATNPRTLIDKDTIVCTSLSAKPSNFGTRFHNHLYAEMELNYLYKAFAVQDIEGAVRGLRAFGIRGSAISMPHKESVMRFLDAIDPRAAEVGAVNTIVNDGGRLTGFNTDVAAVNELLDRKAGAYRAKPAALAGSGGMAKAIASALAAQGFSDVTIVARNEATARPLAERYGFKYAARASGPFALLINATPIGMTAQGLPFEARLVDAAEVVMDSVANPSETDLVKAARSAGKKLITGFDIVVIQAVHQFRLYTGLTPASDAVARAAESART